MALSKLRDDLQLGLDQLGLPIIDHQLEQLLDYIVLIEKWNRTHNLTAVTDLSEMVTKHLLDSLSIATHISTDIVLDVGSGAGLPGIPLAIYFPDKQFKLVDSSSKRVAFLRESKRKLALTNLLVFQSRIEEFQSDPVPLILCRAFSSLIDLADKSSHLLSPNGHWLAMKGVYPEKEIIEVSTNYQIAAVTSIQVPKLDAQRHLVKISRLV